MRTSKDNFFQFPSSAFSYRSEGQAVRRRKLPISVNWHHWHSCEQELPREQYQQFPDLKRKPQDEAGSNSYELTSQHVMQHGYAMIYCSIDSSSVSGRRLRILGNPILANCLSSSPRYCKHLQCLQLIYSILLMFIFSIYFDGHCRARDSMSSRWCDYRNMFNCGVSPVTPENWTSEHMMPTWC